MKYLLFILLTVYSFGTVYNPYYDGVSSTTRYYPNYVYTTSETNNNACFDNRFTLFENPWFQSNTKWKGMNYSVGYSGGYCIYTVTNYDLSNCLEGETFDAESMSCSLPTPSCPPNSEYDYATEGCKCTLPYLPTYDLNGTMECLLAECPILFDEHNPPLPLFKVTTSASLCNFFPMGDNAVLDLDGTICCYGQENDDDDTICGANEIDIGGHCYPIETNDDNSTEPKTCASGSHWSDTANQCVPDATAYNDGNGTINPNTTDNNDSTLLPSENDLADFDDIADWEGVKDAMNGVLNSYILVQLPVNVGGTCTNELTQTFTFMGHSYTLNLAPYLQSLNNYLPIFKGLIIFMFALGGVLIVLASGRSS